MNIKQNKGLKKQKHIERLNEQTQWGCSNQPDIAQNSGHTKSDAFAIRLQDITFGLFECREPVLCILFVLTVWSLHKKWVV